MRRLLILALVLLLAACGRDSEPTETAAGVSSSPRQSSTAATVDAALAADLLARIDADTAMLGLSLEPLPEAIINKAWSSLEGLTDEEDIGDLSSDIEDPLLLALARESLALNSPEAYLERGLDPNGMFAVHLMSIYPAMHWQLSDAEAFRAMLARIEAAAETEFERRRVDGEEIIWVQADGFGLALHQDANFVTAALIADRQDLLRRVANLDPAPRPMQRSEVESFARQRGLLLDTIGYVDFERLVGLLLDSEEDLVVQLRRDTQLGQVAETAACRVELGQLTRLFPRKSFGTYALSDNSISMKATLESLPEFASRLGALADSPVALQDMREGLMAMGVALNLVAARDFGRQLVGGWIETPPQCFLFSNVAENAASWQLALNRPIPPLVTNLHGARLKLSHISQDQDDQPEMAGTLALFMRNPQMLIGMAQMFSPELASLDLRPGGNPQPVPPELLPQLQGMPAWLGLSDTGLGLAVGAGQDAALPAALTAGRADSAILSFGLDLSAYSELLALGLANLPGQGADFDADDTAEAMTVMASLFRQMSGSLHLGEAGIEMRMHFELAD
ncbi:MAG: hypothetical protein ACXIUM_05760 [Wenzhouxiangella sp.]